MTIEEAITRLEANLVQLPPEFDLTQKEIYFAGYIEALRDTHQIKADDADSLYLFWGPGCQGTRDMRKSMGQGLYDK